MIFFSEIGLVDCVKILTIRVSKSVLFDFTQCYFVDDDDDFEDDELWVKVPISKFL